MRLVALTNHYPPEAMGGYGEICADVMEALAGRGHSVVVVTCRSHRLPEHEDRAGVAVWRTLRFVPCAWRRPVRGAQAVVDDAGTVRRALARGMDAAIVWHMRGLVKPSLRLLHDAGIPVLYLLHDRWVLYERPGALLIPWQQIDRLGLARARELAATPLSERLELRAPPIAEGASVGFVSSWLRDEHARRGFRPKHSVIVPLGVDPGRVPEAVRPDAGAARRLLYAGRIHPSKGLHVVLDALELARIPAQLTVAGPVASRSYFERLRRRSDGRPVRWLGPVRRDDVLSLLGDHDVLVYPSIAPEAASLGLLEGMAAGAAIVSSAPGGPREYLVDGENALVHKPGDPAGLASGLDRLDGDQQLLERLRAGARETASRYTLERVVDDVERLLPVASAGTLTSSA